jgi:ubiquinol-cytochrome c reductase cytochrome b subunit
MFPEDIEQEEGARGQNRLVNWLDTRVGIRKLTHEALDEPIPGGARWAYVFGSGLLYIFLSQVITGVFLAMYYVASADHAHATVSYIIKQVSGGSFVRSLHSYGSSAMVVTVMLHLAQTYFWGSYKGRRELLWLSGLTLFALVIGMSFTGYLLPWDQKAYFATAVGTNIASEVPVIGEWLKLLMRGGSEMGTLTLSRFFVAHVFLIPAMMFAFVGLHVFLFRKAGSAGPMDADPVEPEMDTEQFFPKQVIYDIVFATILIGFLGVLSYMMPMELGPKANPADTQFLPRPEWYYLPIFQWLKYWNGPMVIVGIIIIPAVIVILLALLPFYDRDEERRPWFRPIASISFVLVFGGLVYLGWESGHDDASDPAVVKQLAKQFEQGEKFMKAPFESEVAGASLAAQNVALLDPIAAKGKAIYADNSCDGCHGEKGEGTDAGADLRGIGTEHDAAALAKMLREPTQDMIDGDMDPVELTDDELAALIAYLNSLK